MRFSSTHAKSPARPRILVDVNPRGYILLKVAMAIFVASALVAIAAPAIKNHRLKARSAAVANDLRQFANALQAYAKTQGDWPAEIGVNETFPQGMIEQLRPTNWERVTPIGGRYTWSPNSVHQGQRYRAAIVIFYSGSKENSPDRAQLIDLDRLLDDGVLDTGKLRLGFRDQPVYVLEH